MKYREINKQVVKITYEVVEDQQADGKCDSKQYNHPAVLDAKQMLCFASRNIQAQLYTSAVVPGSGHMKGHHT